MNSTAISGMRELAVTMHGKPELIQKKIILSLTVSSSFIPKLPCHTAAAKLSNGLTGIKIQMNKLHLKKHRHVNK